MPVKDVVRIFKALADPARLRIMILLGRRELCVCEIMFVLGMEQSRVSHHMRVLRDAGIAEDVREGRWIIYRIPDASRGLVEGLFTGALRERIEGSGETAADAHKLEACVRENIRGRVCEARPRLEGQ
ncbi:MAG: winged helix-turn-helix transcriptional regulator [Acidobacteria bacterium]|nr:winged helix-turn-helix transcriptional regulator [Acidobacteriota bacterium]